VDGVLLLDKPTGITSNTALQIAKRLYRAEKAGHTGTLDPLASGLLPLCLGEATKFAQSLLDERKEYVADVRFGVATSTGDAEGEVVEESATVFSRTDLDSALHGFLGTTRQLPPRYSALKHKGKSYYEYARAGIEIPRAEREVRIDAIEVVDWTPPTAVLRILCSKGTYVRTLAEDIGRALGSCAHLAGLRRTAVGSLTVDHAITVAGLEAVRESGDLDALLLPVDTLVAALAALDVSDATALALMHGRQVRVGDVAPGHYRCRSSGRFAGTVEVDAAGVIRPVRMLRLP
jgi:tRNA pseudouridine55 synthase